MTKRLTDEELAALERRVRPGYVELFPHELASLLSEVREMRALKAQVDRIGSCGFCCGYGALPSIGDDMPMNRCCDECGGLP